jgi:WD40 repeat protein
MRLSGNFLFTGSDDGAIKIWNMGLEPEYHATSPFLHNSMVQKQILKSQFPVSNFLFIVTSVVNILGNRHLRISDRCAA